MNNHQEVDGISQQRLFDKRIKRDSRYLSLLGISLFSISLMQLTTTTVHADTTAVSQTAVVKNQTAGNDADSALIASSSAASSSATNVSSDASTEANQAKAAAMMPVVEASSAASSSASDSSSASSSVTDNTSNTASAAAVAAASATLDSQTVASTANDTTTSTNYDDATPVTDNDKAIVPDGTQKLDGKYSFIPKFDGSGTTAVSVIGTEKATSKPKTIAADLTSAVKGQVGFKYTNVGFDTDGNSMDMNILFTDWGRLSDAGAAYVETYTTMIYSNFPGAGWVDVKYEFVRSDTGTAENVSGLMTLTDIDGSQTVSVTDDQWNRVDNLYIPESDDPISGQTDNWLRYTEDNGYVTFVSPSENSPSTAKYAMLTFTYTNQSSLTFRYSDGKDGSEPTKMTVWGVNYIPQKPLATATVTPTITVSDSDEKTVTEDTLKDGESDFTYNLNQIIPDEWSPSYYGSVAFTGTLPTNVTMSGFKVIDEMGNDVTQYFTNESVGKNVKFTVNADCLQNAEFYGHRYTIQVAAQATQTDSIQTLPFTLTTTIDNDAKLSNTVNTVVDKMHYLVTHYYIQGTTTSVAPDTRQRVIYGATYSTTSKSLDDYKLVGQNNVSGIFTDENQAAFYEYAPLIVSIPVKYVDQNGKEISPATSLTGRLTTSYDANTLVRTLTGYTWKTTDHATGVFSANNASIIFHYQAKTITIKIRDIDNYDNDLDQELGLTRTVQGLYNDPYQLDVLDVPQWSEIYSGAKSLLSGTYSENMTITLRYKQAWNQNYDNYDGSQTIPVYNGLDKLIGVMQVHPDSNEDTTVVLIKPNGKYLVGTLDDDIDVDTFHQQAAVSKGKSVTITSNTGEKIRVSISKAGAITIAHQNSKTLPVADRSVVSADGKTIQQYIDTKSAVSGLTTTVYSLDGDYSFSKATQHWPNGYTTVYDSTNPYKVKITIRNAKGKVIFNKSKYQLNKTATIKVGKTKWTFEGTAYGALTSELVTVNKAGNGKAYTQRLTIGGTLKSTVVATVKHNRIVKATTLTYGQYRGQDYDDEPEATSAYSGKVMSTQVMTHVTGNQWRVATYNRQGQLTGTTMYSLQSGVTIPTTFASLSARGQQDWLAAHSMAIATYDGSGNQVATKNSGVGAPNMNRRETTALPQTSEAHSKVTLLGMLGLLLSWLLGLETVKRGGKRND